MRGSKLLESMWIIGNIANDIPEPAKGKIFCDIFAGDCCVTAAAKTFGFRVIANDTLNYSTILARYILEQNEGYELFEIGKKSGLITELYGGKYFSQDSAMECDFILDLIENNEIENEIPVLANLITEMNRISYTPKGVYRKAPKYKYNGIIPQSLRLSQVLYHGLDGKVYNKPAEELINEVSGDILYLDPPCTKRQYSADYIPLETITLGHVPDKSERYISNFCFKNRAEESLEHILEAANFEYIAISYEDDGIISLERIEELSKRFAVPGTYTCRRNWNHVLFTFRKR